MQVIDVRERQERVQRRVDRRGDAVLAERAQRIEADHLVFERFAAIARDQAVRACRDTGSAKPAFVIERRSPPLPFTAMHALRLPGQRIGQRRTSSWCCRRRSS